jgi:hypothetical protein
MSANTNNISHAIAYMDVFMRSDTMDSPHEMSMIYQNIDSLSFQDVVSIAKDSVKRSNVYGAGVILREMNTPEFHQYVRKKVDQLRDILLSA